LKIFNRFAIFFLLIIAFINTNAQGVQFVENKGQWDSHVKFKGSMKIGNFFLEPGGYKIVINNTDDIAALGRYWHGNEMSATSTAVAPRSKKIISKAESNDTSVTVHSHAYEMTFANASSNIQIVPESPLNTYNNYFEGKDSTKWKGHCKIYTAVTYKNVYPNIDARYYTDHGSLKYDLIVNPGGDVSKIALRYDGVNALTMKGGDMVIKTSQSDVTEMAPDSYQVDEQGKHTVKSKFVVEGNIVRFKLDNYSNTKTLVIDPTLVFCTLTGSLADNWGYTATYDGQGNFYAGGIAFSQGFPVSNGAFQTEYHGGDNSEGSNDGGAGGGTDIAIIKFTPNLDGRVYATYLGGSGDEQPHSLVADNAGNLIIAGRTHSYNFPLIPAGNTFGNVGTAAAESFDIYISKLSSDGTQLLGSIKIGGSGSDGVNIAPKDITYPGIDPNGGAVSIRQNYGDDARSEVMVDASNNIYLASCTQSPDFPVTANAFEPVYHGGGVAGQDGVVLKLDPTLTNVLLSSFLGGNGDDACFVLDLSPVDNNIYVGGSTTSTDFPGAINGNSGGIDGYVAEINNGGTYNLVRSAYFGTQGNDMLYGLKFDKQGNPYIMGTTTGSWPIVNSAFTSQTGGKQFIAKLQPDLSGLQYSTNFGSGRNGLPDISPVAFLVDRCDNVYVSGWGGDFNSGTGYKSNGTAFGLTVTANNGIRSKSDGAAGDFYFFVLAKDATSQLYGGFFGQIGGFTDHVDGGTSRFDRNGIIYQGICANCNCAQCTQGNPHGTFYPTTSGAWSSSNPSNGDGCNMAALKIAFNLAGIGNGIKASIDAKPYDTVGCTPLSVNFIDTLDEGKTYVWIFGDGTSATTTVDSISHTFNAVGIYTVTLISIDSSTCNISDTSYTHIRVGSNKALLSFVDFKLPPCDSLKYQFINTSVAPPGQPFSPNSFEWNFGDGTILDSGADTVLHNFTAPGIYLASLTLLDTGYCNGGDAVTDTLRIAVNVKAQFTATSGCAPYYSVITNTSLAGEQFFWNFGDGTTSTDINPPPHLYSDTGIYIISLVVMDSTTCNKIDSFSTTVTASPKPSAAFTFGPVPPQADTPIMFVNNSFGATSYKWLFGDGDSLKTVELDTTVSHIYNKAATYNACLIAYNSYGCTDTVCQPVSAIVVPLIDVPNAFTPNGDGVNDQIHVRGYGIDKMDWRIYNRWGTVVYQSFDPDLGWDGKYKGVLQPQEVYTYVLDVQFTDETKYRKTGDITLLR
jgi:gliding motility-associated-like protein